MGKSSFTVKARKPAVPGGRPEVLRALSRIFWGRCVGATSAGPSARGMPSKLRSRLAPKPAPPACPRCDGRMRLLAMVSEPRSVSRYLRGLGEPTEAPARAPARGPPYWKSRVLRRAASDHAAESRAPPTEREGRRPPTRGGNPNGTLRAGLGASSMLVLPTRYGGDSRTVARLKTGTTRTIEAVRAHRPRSAHARRRARPPFHLPSSKSIRARRA